MTTLNAIDIQLGRTGAMTPVGKFTTVFVGGANVSQATLHNAEEIARKDIRVGDRIIVRRAGDVVPEIIGPVLPREEDYPVFVMPTTCPCCGAAAVKDEKYAVTRCSSSWMHCSAQLLAGLYHFGSRSGMKIDGLGEVAIELLVNHSLVVVPKDLYELTVSDLQRVPELDGKDGENLIAAIQKSRKVTLERFLIALGIRHANEGTAKRLVRAYGNLDAIKDAALSGEVEKTDDIGPITAASLKEFFQDWDAIKFLADMLEIEQTTGPIAPKAGPLSGKSIVLTGSLPTLSREQAEQLIEEHGGTNSSSVSKNTSYLLLGEKPGSKLKKAEALGIAIIGEEELFKLIS